MKNQLLSQIRSLATATTSVTSWISLVGSKKAVAVAVLVEVELGVTVGVGVSVGVGVGVLLGGNVGVTTTNCASTVTRFKGDKTSGVTARDGVGLKKRVGRTSVGASVTSLMSCGPCGVLSSVQAANKIVKLTTSKTHFLMPERRSIAR